MREHLCIVSVVLAMVGTLAFVVGCNQQAAEKTPRSRPNRDSPLRGFKRTWT